MARRAARRSDWSFSCGISRRPFRFRRRDERGCHRPWRFENVEQAILNIYNRAKPELIGICSTGVTETKGMMSRDTSSSFGRNIRILPNSHWCMFYSDFKDAFQDGWEKTVARMIEVLVDKPANAARRDSTASMCCRAAI